MPSKTDVMIDGAGRVCVAFGCVHKYGQSPGYKVIAYYYSKYGPVVKGVGRKVPPEAHRGKFLL